MIVPLKKNRSVRGYVIERRLDARTLYESVGSFAMRAKSYEMGRLHAYDDILTFLNNIDSCECGRQECKQRLEVLRAILHLIDKEDCL